MGVLDLTGIRDFFDQLLADSAVTATDTNTVVDDVLNEETGELEPVDGPGPIYTGPGLIVPLTSYGANKVPELAVAATPVDSETTHRLLLPLAAPKAIRVGLKVVQTAVDPLMGDLQLVGRPFKVTEIPSNSALSVLRIAFLKPWPEPGAAS